MPVTFPAETIFLEAHYFAYENAELRLDCEAVVLESKAILVRGVETRHLTAMKWTPDALSLHSLDKNHWHPVGRPTVIDANSARFPPR